jgi:hypothetical protein
VTKRRWILLIATALVIAAVGSAAFAWWQVSRPLRVTVENESSAPLSGLQLASSRGPTTNVPEIAPGQSVTVTPRVGPGEDALTMLDARGRSYSLLGYFEGNPHGAVTVFVTGASDVGLVGRVVDHTRYAPGEDAVLKVLPQ